MTDIHPPKRTNTGETTSSTATRPSSSRESTFYANGRTSDSWSSQDTAAEGHPRLSHTRRRSRSSHDEARGYYYGRHSNKWLFNDFSVRHTVGGAFKKIKRKVVG